MIIDIWGDKLHDRRCQGGPTYDNLFSRILGNYEIISSPKSLGVTKECRIMGEGDYECKLKWPQHSV